MNPLQRRKIARGNVVDLIARAPVNESRRRQAKAAKQLRKALASSRSTFSERDTMSYPPHA